MLQDHELIERARQAGMVISPVNWEPEIRAFADEDAARPPQTGGILFVGDSDIRFWREDGRFEQDFPGLPVINRGFGGARTWELLAWFRQIVDPYRPVLIVYNCGDNDLLEAGVTEPMIRDGFRLFVEAVRRRQPQVRRVYYTSIKPCPQLLRLWPRQQRTNELIRQYCQAQPDTQFVPYFQTVLTEDGSIRPEAFRSDEVHLAAAHYGEVAKLLRPLLERDWPAASSSST